MWATARNSAWRGIRRTYASRKDYKGTPNEEEWTKRGLAYEFHCIDVLRQFSFYTVHKGIAGDKGIDFQGFWQVVPADEFDHRSPTPHMFNIIGECKHERNLCRSVYIKELEGVLSRWRHKQHHGSFITNKYPERMQLATKLIPIIGLIVNSSGYSEPALAAFESSHNPMIISVIRPADWLPEDPTPDQLRKCLLYWKPNEAAQALLPGMSSERMDNNQTTDGTLVPSIRLLYNDIDVSTLELPKQ